MTVPICMNILFITAHPYLPQMFGGLQRSTDQLCKSLMQRGHKVAVLGSLIPGGPFAVRSRIKMQINSKLFGCKVSKDTRQGYPVWRTWCPWSTVEYVAKAENAHLIVVLAMQSVRMGLAAKETSIPVIMMLQDIEFHQHGGSFTELGDIPCVANSHFTATTYHRAFGVNPTVIYPFISKEKYRTETSRENVTFINPVPQKGRDIALDIARLCPDIPFTFVEAWPLSAEQRRDLMVKVSVLHNVTLLSPQNDMREIYGKCKLLLVPSVWEEAYGRVATEAQVSGIPVVASTRGGLPEAVGSGGILLDPAGPIEPWVNSVRKLWSDKAYYNELSAAALAYAQRPEISFTHQIDLWEQVLHAVGARPAGSAGERCGDKVVSPVALEDITGQDMGGQKSQ